MAGVTVALGLRRAWLISSPERGSTWWAQGGIAAAIARNDSPGAHAADTVAVAGGIAVTDAVDALTSGGPAAIDRLVAMGASFDRDESGALLLGREGGHRRRRVVHADGDATGIEVMRALHAALDSTDSVEVLDGTVLDLVRSHGRVAGVIAELEGRRQILLAPAVILATGGAGQLFLRTTNPPGVTGAGIMIGGRAGARLADLEFVQFHPTALLTGTDPMPLLTEALRGEGATLVDSDGRRFLVDVHPMAELAPRDVVARAIFAHRERGGDTFLDARGVPDVRTRFPTVTASTAAVGLDPADDLLPVSPAAHYFMGGIDADDRGRSSLAGLWAVGECASTGVHGANRLASNSLLEGLVFGARVAADVEEHADGPGGDVSLPVASLELPREVGPAFEDLRAVMWEHVGVIRSADSLARAGVALEELTPALEGSLAGRDVLELARLVRDAAERRRESRGGHYRVDYPDTDPSHQRRYATSATPANEVVVPA